MTELAPRHKMGLPIAGPMMLAGGTVAYGDAVPRVLDLSQFGAAVVGPITHYNQLGNDPPRLGETVGGFVLETGLQNRGVKAVVRKFGRLWSRLGCPIIAQIADTHPEDASATARELLGQESLLGLELSLAPHAQPAGLIDLVQAIRYENNLPLLVKLPLEKAETLAGAAVESRADALVVGQPPTGAAVNREGSPQHGSLYGPLAFGSMLHALHTVARMETGVPLIACGGIHNVQQARQALDAGAVAVQLDSIVWVEPGCAMQIAHEV